MQLDDYFEAVASDAPIPGGGSVATIVGAGGAALVAMVARICAANPRYVSQRGLIDELASGSDRLRRELLDARTRDESAFAEVIAVQSRPAGDPERTAALEAALTTAADEPLRAATLSLRVLLLAERALELPNRNVVSDLGCAAEFAAAAVAACGHNVRVNHRFMHDDATIARQAEQLESLERDARAGLQRVRDGVARLNP